VVTLQLLSSNEWQHSAREQRALQLCYAVCDSKKGFWGFWRLDDDDDDGAMMGIKISYWLRHDCGQFLHYSHRFSVSFE
jgi:hypothetical protein